MSKQQFLDHCGAIYDANRGTVTPDTIQRFTDEYHENLEEMLDACKVLRQYHPRLLGFPKFLNGFETPAHVNC